MKIWCIVKPKITTILIHRKYYSWFSHSNVFDPLFILIKKNNKRFYFFNILKFWRGKKAQFKNFGMLICENIQLVSVHILKYFGSTWILQYKNWSTYRILQFFWCKKNLFVFSFKNQSRHHHKSVFSSSTVIKFSYHTKEPFCGFWLLSKFLVLQMIITQWFSQ